MVDGRFDGAQGWLWKVEARCCGFWSGLGLCLGLGLGLGLAENR